MRLKKPRAAYPWNYPWAITMSIGTPVGGAPSSGASAGSSGGGSSGAVAEDYNLGDYHETKFLSDALRKHYDLHHPSVTDKDSLESYSKNSVNLNRYLFSKKNSGHFDEIQEERSKNLSKAIKNSSPYPKSFSVYSGLHSNIHPEIIKNNGEIFHFPKFISSSTDLDVAKRFSSPINGERHIFKFDIPANYSEGRFIGNISHKPDEDEYLINKDRLIKVGDKIHSFKDHKGNNVHVWQAHLIDEHEAQPYADKNMFAKNELDSYRTHRSPLITEDYQFDIPNEDKSLDKSRYTFPQIDTKKFLKDIGSENYSSEFAKTSKLKPTQKHFNADKVFGISSGGREISPIIISKDDFIVDGHHRWLAAHDRKEDIRAYRVNKGIDEILSFLKDKPYVEKKKLDESFSDILLYEFSETI